MNQQISECMDGELHAEVAAQLLDQMSKSADFQAEWTFYHMVSDGMCGSPDLSPGFAERLVARLADEPTILAPRQINKMGSNYGMYAMYAAASLAAVAVVGWVAFTPQLSPTAPQIARQETAAMPAPKIAPQRPAVSPLKPEDHDYLMAHQAVSPGGAMQGVTPYVRTVSFGAGDDAR